MSAVRLRVDPIACAGHGMCAELLPEVIGRDPWGYPILSPAAAAIPRPLRDHARRAASACPTLAWLLDDGTGRHR